MRLKGASLEQLERLGQGLCVAAAGSIALVPWCGPWALVVAVALLGSNHVVERMWKRRWKARVESDQKEIDEAMRS